MSCPHPHHDTRPLTVQPPERGIVSVQCAHPITDWDDAYASEPYIADASDIIGAWSERARRFRARTRPVLDIEYGPSARSRFDLFRPATPPRGLVMFLHGGFWMSHDKSDWSHLAGAAVERGFAVAIPSYDLCPNVRIREIARQVGRAVTAACKHVGGPLLIIGHSAGAQLAARLMSTQSPLPARVIDRLQHVVGISGLYDLRPLLRASELNRTLRLTVREADRESPVCLRPFTHPRLTVWVGGDERPEYQRQSRVLSELWFGLGARVERILEPGRHHFDVIEGLSDSGSALARHVFDPGSDRS